MVDVRYLRSGELADIADMNEYIDAIRDGYRQQAGDATADSRTKLFRDPDGMLMYYGAILPESGVMGTFNYVGEFPSGDAWFLTFLADANTGEPLAFVDSPSVNPYKTGATGGVAADALAREDASTAAVIGTGVQAKGQLLAVSRVRDLTEVRAYSPTETRRRGFASELDRRLTATVRAVGSSREAIAGADIVITATTADDPVFDGSDIEPGTHVTAMGQSHPERRELDAETVRRAVYVPDLRERALSASGELLGAVADGEAAEDHVHAALGEVVAGEAAGRTSDDQITVFDSGGTGIETIAATHMVYGKALEAGRGVRVSMTPGSEGSPEL